MTTFIPVGHPGKSKLEINKMSSYYNKPYFEFCMNYFAQWNSHWPKTATRETS